MTKNNLAVNMVHLDQNTTHSQKRSENLDTPIKLEQNFPTTNNQWGNGIYNEKGYNIANSSLALNGPKVPEVDCNENSNTQTISIINNSNEVKRIINSSEVNDIHHHYQKVYHDGTEKIGSLASVFLTDDIKRKPRSNELKSSLKYMQNKYRSNCNMGSNVSRDAIKWLPERRTQSSGDLISEYLCEGKKCDYACPNGTEASESNLFKHQDQTKNSGSKTKHPLLANLKKADRNQVYGSLPNHLDSEETYRENTGTDTGTQMQDELSLRNENKMYPSSQNQTAYDRNTKLFNKNETSVNLKLTLNRSSLDVGCDQGYGSERSPEEDFPPNLTVPHKSFQGHLKTSHKPKWITNKISEREFDFIKEDCCFIVKVVKNERGLGISVYGGIDANVPYRGLIRIKRIFPNQSAWSTGMLQQGDILLEGNGIKLTGLTNHEALEVLRTASNIVTLKVCRPIDEIFHKLSPPAADPPKPPQRLQLTNTLNVGEEFEIVMVKQQGSLGFTLRKENESVFGHYVRALVRDPAVSDGRIKPGDKIVAVNDVPLCPMTHEEAVIFLRQAKDRVKLRLFRDNSQTTIGPISPSSSEQLISIDERPKASLRPEAMNLLIDLANKNRKQSCDSLSTESSIQSRNTSPRRIIRNNNKTNFSDNDSSSFIENEKTILNRTNLQNQTYTVENVELAICSDSTISQPWVISQSMKQHHPIGNENLDNTYTIQPLHESSEELSQYYNEEELWRLMEGIEYGDKVNHLGRSCQFKSSEYQYTPITSRKSSLQLSAVNGYELNNLDNEALDAPVYNPISHNTNLNYNVPQHMNNTEFASLPCERVLMSNNVNNSNNYGVEFSYNNPIYQSAYAQVNPKSNLNFEGTFQADKSRDGMQNLLKWKGVMFGTDEAEKHATLVNVQTPVISETTLTTSPDSSCATMIEICSAVLDNKDRMSLPDAEHQIITVELSRGWNSRLGFSLRSMPNSSQTIISAIYSDSVAAKDGRLKVGDKLIMINDEFVESKTTTEIIDLLRIIRGSIVLTVKRAGQSIDFEEMKNHEDIILK